MTIHAFDNPWYSGIIERFDPGHSTYDTPDTLAIKSAARANLAAACIIAQAIDGLAEAIKNREHSE
jgi:hypothetical protein